MNGIRMNNMDPKLTVKKSKNLSKILRHDPESVGIVLDNAGWCEVSKLLVAVKMSQEELDYVVDNNNKKRFEYNQDKTKIRASQGHSVNVDLQYRPMIPPDYLWHGTSEKTLKVLLLTGINKMNRHAVHLSADLETAMMVAKRKGKPTALKVHAKAMLGEGFQFYLSTNGVWLVDHVPSKYISNLEYWLD